MKHNCTALLLLLQGYHFNSGKISKVKKLILMTGTSELCVSRQNTSASTMKIPFLIPPKGSLFGSYGILPIISGMFIPCWYGAFGVMEFRFGNAESLTSEKGSCTLTALFLAGEKKEALISSCIRKNCENRLDYNTPSP